MALPTFDTVSSLAYGAARTSSAVPVPASIAANDVIIVALYLEGANPRVAVTPPSGFTEVTFPTTQPQTVTSLTGQRVFWKRATGADSGTYTFTHASTATAAVATSWSGVVTSGTPVEAPAASATDTAGTATPAVQTTTLATERMLLFHATSFGSRSWTPPTGWTETYDGAPSYITADRLGQSALGGTGTISATASASTAAMTTTLLALIPASTSASGSRAETSTSTDGVTFSLGRIAAAETSTSTDGITTVRKDNFRYPLEQSLSQDGVQAEFVRADIDNYQFVVVEDNPLTMDPWVPFGFGQTIAGGFAPGGYEVVSQDNQAVLGDYRLFGTDRHAPPSWAWSLFTDTYTPEDSLAWVEAMARVWNHKVRKNPEAVLALRYRVANRTRRVYGRPRRFTPIPDKIQNGKTHIEATFDLAENVFYEDDEQTVSASSVPTFSSGAGIILPQALPWVFTTQAPPQTKLARIGGSAATWVDIDIYGPAVNPWVKIGNLTWGLSGVMNLGEKITISGKPWSLGVRRADGTHLPGWIDPRSRLSALQMDPGDYSVQFGGWNASGPSQAIVRWRNAHESF